MSRLEDSSSSIRALKTDASEADDELEDLNASNSFSSESLDSSGENHVSKTASSSPKFARACCMKLFLQLCSFL